MSKYVILKTVDLVLDGDNIEIRYSKGDEYITVRGEQFEQPLLLELHELDALVEFKKAIDDLA